MGGRGASSGISIKKKVYGTEYRRVLKKGNIKFVKYNDASSAKTPMETMTKGRVYVTVNDDDELVAITYYDNTGKRTKQIDLNHMHNKMQPHTHHGYFHNENDSKKGAARLTDKERRMVDKVKEFWLNRKKGSSSIEVDYTLMYGFSTEETHVRIVTLSFFLCKS